MTISNTTLTDPPARETGSTIDTTPGFYGLRVDAAAFTVAVFGWGTGFYGPPVYLEIVHHSRGWPIALVSGAVTLHFLVGLVLIPSLPALYRRFGLPVVIIAGSVIMAIGLLGWALASAPWELYVAALLSGAGWSALGAVAINAIVSPWFVAKRPLALGIAFNGGSAGGVIFSPFWIALIDQIGFPAAALVVGLAMIATLGALAILVLTRTPNSLDQNLGGSRSVDSGLAIDGISGEATAVTQLDLFRNRAFLTLCVGMTLALFAQTGLVAHLVSVLAPVLGRQGAGLTAGVSGVAAIIGRLAVGSRASGTSNWRAIASGSLISQALGCIVLILAHGSNPAFMVVGVVLFGLGVGNAISVPPVIANLEFPGADATRAVSLIVAISQGVYAIAPAVFGLLRQVFSDQAIFFATSTVEFLAVVAYLSRGSTNRLDHRADDGS
jgi:MFS family permease